MLYEVHDLAADEWKGILSLYCKLAKVAQVYPQCYELKGVHYNESTPIAEGGFAKVYKGTYQEEQICLKVVNKANKNMLRVSSFSPDALCYLNRFSFVDVYQGARAVGSPFPCKYPTILRRVYNWRNLPRFSLDGEGEPPRLCR